MDTGVALGQTVVKDMSAVLGSRLSRLSKQSADAFIESISLADSPKLLSDTLIHVLRATALSFTYSLPVWLHAVECVMEECAIKRLRHGSATVKQVAIKKTERSLAAILASRYGSPPDLQVVDMLSCTPVRQKVKTRRGVLSAQPPRWRVIFEAKFTIQYTFVEAEIVDPENYDFDSENSDPEISEWALERLEEDLLEHMKSVGLAYDIAGFDVASVEVLDDSLYSVFLDASLDHEFDTVLCSGDDS
jgi:hypothetical protein